MSEEIGAANMSLRDWFAGQAIPAIATVYAISAACNQGVVLDPETMADDAYKVADAMLKARQPR